MLRILVITAMTVAGGLLLGQESRPAEQLPAAARITSLQPSAPIISLAGDSVSMQPPSEWAVWERPTGREIRLLISPSLDNPKDRLDDGIWICFHHPSVSNPRIQPRERMKARFRRHAGQRRTIPGPVAPIEIQQAKGLQQEFQLDDEVSGRLAGVHIFADTTWGTLEVFAIAPAKAYPRRKAKIQGLLESIRLSAPQDDGVVVTQAQAATPILGSWKAFRSRIHLRAGGQVVVVLDKSTRLTTRLTSDGSSLPPRRLEGRFVAERDLIYVTWKDGSRLNFRWRLEGGVLLLTDHQGQTAQLQRIVH